MPFWVQAGDAQDIILKNNSDDSLSAVNKYVYEIRRNVSPYLTDTLLTAADRPTFLPYVPPGDSTIYQIRLAAFTGDTLKECVRRTAFQIIKIPPTPVADFGLSRTDGCSPLTVSFVNNSRNVPDNAGFIYVWQVNNGPLDTTQTLAARTFVNNGNLNRRDTIRLTVVAPDGCTYTTQRTVVTYPKPNPVRNVPDTVCSGEQVTFNVTGNGLSAYNWIINGVSNSQPAPQQTFTNNGSQPIAIAYSVSVTTVSGCTDQVKDTLLVFPRPQLIMTASPEATCGDVPTTVSFSTNLPFTPGGRFFWTFGDGNDTTITTVDTVLYTYPPNFTGSQQTYQTSVTLTTAQGCVSNTSNQQVNIRPRVFANFTADTNRGCSPLTVFFSNASTFTDDNFLWYVKPLGTTGLGTSFVSNQPGFGFSRTFNNTTTTIQRYVVTLVATDDNGTPICTASFSDTIEVLPLPTADFSITNTDPDFCSPATFILDPSASSAGQSYRWNFGDGSPVFVTSQDTAVSRTYSNNTSVDRSITVTLEILGAGGCSGIKTQNLTVRPSVTANFSLALSDSCSPVTASFTNLSSAASQQFTWLKNGSLLSSSAILNPQILTNNTDLPLICTFTLVARNASGTCPDTATPQVLTILPQPVAVASANRTAGCTPLTTQLSAKGSTNNLTYKWYSRIANTGNFALFATRTDTTAFAYNLTNNTAATVNYEIKMEASNSAGCVSSDIFTITVYPAIQAAFSISPDTIGCSPLTTTLTNASTGNNIVSTRWQVNNEPTIFASSFTRTFTNASSSVTKIYDVNLQVTSSSGCTDSVRRKIVCETCSANKRDKLCRPGLFL